MINPIKHILSRFILVYFIVFFIRWTFNLTDQINTFVYNQVIIDYILLFMIILIAIILFIGYIIINICLSLIHKNDPSGYSLLENNRPDIETWKSNIEITENQKYKYVFFINSVKHEIHGDKFKLNSELENIYYEQYRIREATKLEHYCKTNHPKRKFSEYTKSIISGRWLIDIINNFFDNISKLNILFLILLATSLWVIEGNPIIKNFYGLHKSHINEAALGEFETVEYNKIIVPKMNAKHVIKRIEQNCNDREDCIVEKRGYVFVQAGIFDGYKSYNYDYSFLKCLSFALLERLIHTSLYFLIPYLIGFFYIKEKDVNF